MKIDFEDSYEVICVTFLSVSRLMMSEHEHEHEHEHEYEHEHEHENEHEHGYQVSRRGYLNSQYFSEVPLHATGEGLVRH